MSETLYLQFNQNVKVNHSDVKLQDVAQIYCGDPNILQRCLVFPLMHLPKDRPGRYVVEVMDIVKKIARSETNLEFVTTGETAFIVTYVNDENANKISNLIKIAGICIIIFCGMSFSIMTFDNDVDIGKLFSQIYQQVMGKESPGFTILEIMYSIGIGVGVLFFFHHFGKWKMSQDPTPMQVQMRTYEDEINKTMIENKERCREQKEVLRKKK